ncbi:T9SS type A sorting domain-containing protein [bacterium]|nr:T9SS type A sorting domain-containing protein [bacterium]
MMSRLLALVVLIALVPLAAAAQFAVGTADVTFIDPDRDDRPVPCDLYYPAVADGSGQPPADPPAAGFAAVSFGHGYQMSAGVYGWVAERLARIGCVVAVARTGGELFPDHEEFGLDLAFAARAARDAGSDEASPLFGRMGERTLVMGHSMGGGASFLAMASDPQLTAVASFAAAETDPSAIAACGAIDRPALLFAGTNDCVTPPADHQIPMFEALAGGWRTLATLAGASHCQFNEYSFLCALGEFCSADISRGEQHDLVWLLLEPWVRAVVLDEADQFAVFQERLSTTAGVAFEQAGTPTMTPLLAAGRPRLEVHPNPANPRTTVVYELPEPTRVRLRILDLRGRVVRELVTGAAPAGTHAVTWDGRDAAGRGMSSGVYLARLTTTRTTTVARLTLVR